MFKSLIVDLFTEGIESIVGDPIVIPKNYLLVEERPKTTHDIDSSAIVQAGYSRKKKELYLRFSSNPSILYIYSGISRHFKDKFKFSLSKGQFFHKYIRNKFKTSKILGA
jgi:hypothetical protein